MSDKPTSGYQHSQRGPWYLLLIAIGLIMLALGWLLREKPVAPTLLPLVGSLFVVLGASFQRLTVADKGDRLKIAFGPLPLLQRKVLYEDIRAVEIGRTLLLDGWGIHYSIRGGWVWNLWGRDCVVIHLRKSVLRVGTDDAANLSRFLDGKISGQKA